MPDYILNVDELDGSVRYFSTDEATDTVRIWTAYESDPLVEQNTLTYNDFDQSGRFSKLGDAQVMYKVATIAPWEMADLVKRQVITWGGQILDDKAFNTWLMDPDYRKIRQVRPLKLGV